MIIESTCTDVGLREEHILFYTWSLYRIYIHVLQKVILINTWALGLNSPFWSCSLFCNFFPTPLKGIKYFVIVLDENGRDLWSLCMLWWTWWDCDINQIEHDLLAPPIGSISGMVLMTLCILPRTECICLVCDVADLPTIWHPVYVISCRWTRPGKF